MTFTFSIESILAALRDPFNPKLLIDRLSEDEELARLFVADAGVWEKYTIRDHTLMVFSIFERFHALHLKAEEKTYFRLFLALHDIGKPLAIEQTGEKANQAQFTVPFLRAALEVCGFPKRDVDLASELETQDLLGRYLKDQLSLEETTQELQRIAEVTGYSVSDVLRYLTTFYQSDAGAYTEVAGGVYSLDYLFEFDEQYQRMSFSSQLTKGTKFEDRSPLDKYQELAVLWTSSID